METAELAGRLLVYGGVYALVSSWWAGARGALLILAHFLGLAVVVGVLL